MSPMFNRAARYLPVSRPLDQEQVQAILNAHLRRAKSLPSDTPSGYHDENGVPIVWDNPQAAALAWQQEVDRERSIARRYPGEEAPVTPSLQVWPDGLPQPYGMLNRDYYLDPGNQWDGYHRMGPGHSSLPLPQQPTSRLPGYRMPF